MTDEYNILPEQQFYALNNVLMGDVHECMRIFQTNDTLSNRRNLVRGACAYIEGTSYGIKAWALEQNRSVFTPEEINLIKELDYSIKENGEVKKSNAKIRTIPNIKFAFKVIAKALGTDFSLDTSGNGMDSIGKLFEVRDRITHPKSAKMLEVELEELGILAIAIQFHNDNISSLLQIHRNTLAAKAAELKTSSTEIKGIAASLRGTLSRGEEQG